MNRLVGKIGALVTGLAVLAFAVSMIVSLFYPSIFASCFSSIFIAIGFVLFMCAIYALNSNEEYRAAGMAGIIFAAIYATIIFLVYYAECTTVRLNGTLSTEALSISEETCIQSQVGSAFAEKARMLPVTFVIKARKM